MHRIAIEVDDDEVFSEVSLKISEIGLISGDDDHSLITIIYSVQTYRTKENPSDLTDRINEILRGVQP